MNGTQALNPAALILGEELMLSGIEISDILHMHQI